MPRRTFYMNRFVFQLLVSVPSAKINVSRARRTERDRAHYLLLFLLLVLLPILRPSLALLCRFFLILILFLLRIFLLFLLVLR